MSYKSMSNSKSNTKNKTSPGKPNLLIKGSDDSKSEKNQHKSDHLKNTQVHENRFLNKEDAAWQERIKQVMELTRRTEDEVIMALHDSDGDLNRAVNDLLEGISSEWEVKKKKARQSGGLKSSCDQSIKLDSNSDWDDKRCLRTDNSSRIRGRVGHINRGWHRRENKENEKNDNPKTEAGSAGSTRNRGSFYGRSGRGGRGGGRGLGPKTFANRADFPSNSQPHSFHRPIETWTGNEETQTNSKISKSDSWGTLDVNEDWENEEYTGSLADTKVFTPSILISNAISAADLTQDDTIPCSETIISQSSIPHNSQKQVKQRPRLPPPSKIPSSAVEMPGDASSISFIDVQFGALEFNSEKDANDVTTQDKYNHSGCSNNTERPNIESVATSSKNVVKSICPLNIDASQNLPNQNLNVTSKVLNTDLQSSQNICSLKSQGSFTSRSTNSHSADSQKEDLTISSSLSNSSSFAYQTSKVPFTTPVTSNFSQYVCNNQTEQRKFPCTTTTCNSTNFSTMSTASQVVYSSTYIQPSITTFSQTSSTTSIASSIYNHSTTTSQGYPSKPVFTTTPISQYQSQTTYSNTSNHPSYNVSGYQSQSSVPSYQTSNTVSYVSSMNQGSSVYSNSAQSVYSSNYPGYVSQNQIISQDHKIGDSKDMQFENNVSSTSSSVSSTTCSLVHTSSVNVSQSKCTISNVVSKSIPNSLVCNSSSTTISNSGSGNTSNIAPILSHQYIMGQSVPYATFQQPHMYSYEDLQLMQQRMSHMPTTGYYDTSLGYQTTAPVTSLGNSRSDNISSVQNVQGAQAVQGQYNNDARFSRSDNNTSPVSSSLSQQTATQHQQPLMNPIPPGYAYFYGGGLMPASGFQYGTPAIYPQIATAGNAGTTTSAYGSKPASYSTGYSGANYDSLSNTGTSGDYKQSSGYTANQTSKSSSASGTTNAAGTTNTTDMNSAIYSKSHVTLSKVNSYEKQTFHSATPPPFGLTNNQSANVISGYGAAHLFIPTVPHQLHQQLHQDSGSSSGQRSNSNTQNKAQVKPGYSTSYWTGSN